MLTRALKSVSAKVLMVVMLSQSSHAVEPGAEGWYVLSTIYYGTVLPTHVSKALSDWTVKVSKDDPDEVNRLILRTVEDAVAFRSTGEKTIFLETLLFQIRGFGEEYNAMTEQEIAEDVIARAQKIVN